MEYKIKDKELKKLWLILSKDSFVNNDNILHILKVAQKHGIDKDSITYFAGNKINFDQMEDLSRTVSFFGDRLIILKDFDISDLKDDDINKLCDIIEKSESTHFAISATYETEKNVSAKKYIPLITLAQEKGIYQFVKAVDDKYLAELIINKAKSLDTILSKDIANIIIQNVGKDIGLLLQETHKYAAYSSFTEIDKEIVEAIGVKTLEASVFSMIDHICNKNIGKALETLNKLFYIGTDEIAIIGAIATGFSDINHCKLAARSGISYQEVHKDFGSGANSYRYQKAMSNSTKFTIEQIEGIINLLLKTDIALKSTSGDKKQLLSVSVAQIIAKGR